MADLVLVVVLLWFIVLCIIVRVSMADTLTEDRASGAPDARGGPIQVRAAP
jgi:Tfp pilus assembly protein PilX